MTDLNVNEESFEQSSVSTSPPAIYYGALQSNGSFIPEPGMLVTAWINGNLCGQATTFNKNGQIMFAIDVSAIGPGSSACGFVGQEIYLEVNGENMSPTVIWDDRRVWEIQLIPGYWIYLPVVER